MFAGARMSELWLHSGSGSLRSLRAGLVAHPEPRGAPAASASSAACSSQPPGLGEPPLPGRVADPTALALPPSALGPLQPSGAPTPLPDSARRPPASHPAPSFLHSFRQRAFLGCLRRALHKASPTFPEWPRASRLPCPPLPPRPKLAVTPYFTLEFSDYSPSS